MSPRRGDRSRCRGSSFPRPRRWATDPTLSLSLHSLPSSTLSCQSPHTSRDHRPVGVRAFGDATKATSRGPSTFGIYRAKMAGHLAQQVLSTLGIASTLLSLKTFCLPGEPCYPNAHTISSLNQSLHGHLIHPDVPDFGCVTSECLSQVSLVTTARSEVASPLTPCANSRRLAGVEGRPAQSSNVHKRPSRYFTWC